MSVFNLTLDEAYDVVDAYGPDADLWPAEYKSGMDRALQSFPELADYIDDTRRIEDMLENWDEDDDGAQIDLSDLDWDPNQDDDQDGDDQDDGDDEPEPIAIDMSGQGGGTNDDTSAAEQAEEDDDQILEVHASDLQDMDDLDGSLTDIIRKEIELAGRDKAAFNVFTKDYDKILDVTPPHSTSVAEIDQHVQRTTGPLQKELRRLIAARTQSKRLPGLRRGRLHGPNLHRILSGDDRVFFRREEAPQLNTAVMLNLDCSGSMAGTRLKLAAETAYALAAVFNRLGIAFECLGFTTANSNHPDYKEWSSHAYNQELQEAAQVATIHRYQPVAMYGFKRFEERWNPEVQRRLAHSFNHKGGDIAGQHMGGTPEPCGNEFAARRLLQRPEQRKIMITMTDGEPTCQAYNCWDAAIARKRAADVVKLIEGAGIDLIGIGIQHHAPKAYYSNALVINNLDEMPAQLLAIFKKLLVGK